MHIFLVQENSFDALVVYSMILGQSLRVGSFNLSSTLVGGMLAFGIIDLQSDWALGC